MTSEAPSEDSRAPRNGAQTADERVSAGQTPARAFLETLAERLAASPHNLVARGERPAVLERHVLECDTLARRLEPAGRWLDLGTGGGLPGLVLAARHPRVRWTLVDATRKKADAVADFARDLGVGAVTVLHARAETLAHDPDHRGRYDGVVARAVAPLPTLLELARGFLRTDGLLVALKGPGWGAEVAAAARAMELLRMVLVHSERLPSGVRETWVVTMRAEGPPPTGYPRGDGLPKHRPL